MTIERRVRLLAVLGAGFGLAVTVGNTIGTGILRTPAEIAKQIDSIPIYFAVWAVGALYALLGANIVAELATRVPRSGGLYVYPREAFGPYAGFVSGWGDWIGTAGSVAAVAIVMSESILQLFPSLGLGSGTLAVVLIVVIAVCQWSGVRVASKLQTFAAAMKAIVLVGLVAACLLIGRTAPAHLWQPRNLPLSLSMVVLGLQGVIYTFDGWTGAIYFSEELKKRRDVVRSIFGGLAIVAVIYFIVNAGFLSIVPLAGLAETDLAASAVAATVFGASGDAIVRTVIVILLLSSLSALLLMASRVIYGLGRDGLFTNRVLLVNDGGTPVVAHAMSTAVAAAFAATGTFNRVIAVLAFFFVANYLLVFTTLFVIRRRIAADAETYRAWGHPWTTIVAVAVSLAFVGGALLTDTANSVTALLLIAASYPVYLIGRRAIERGAP